MELLTSTSTTFPIHKEDIVKKIAAKEYYKRIKRAAFLNAINVRAPFDSCRGDLYLTLEAKKLRKWVRSGHSRPKQHIYKEISTEYLDDDVNPWNDHPV